MPLEACILPKQCRLAPEQIGRKDHADDDPRDRAHEAADPADRPADPARDKLCELCKDLFQVNPLHDIEEVLRRNRQFLRPGLQCGRRARELRQQQLDAGRQRGDHHPEEGGDERCPREVSQRQAYAPPHAHPEPRLAPREQKPLIETDQNVDYIGDAQPQEERRQCAQQMADAFFQRRPIVNRQI